MMKYTFGDHVKTEIGSITCFAITPPPHNNNNNPKSIACYVESKIRVYSYISVGVFVYQYTVDVMGRPYLQGGQCIEPGHQSTRA